MGEKLVSMLSSNLIRFNIRLHGYYSKAKYSVAQKDHYGALGVQPNATQDEIKSAYYKLSLQYHPDKDTSVGAKERFQEISQAYEVLGNYELRKQYDIRMRVVDGTKSNVKKRPVVTNEFIVRPPKSGRIYDFDEWTRQHYTATLHKQQKFINDFEKRQRYRRQTFEPGSFHILPVIIIVSICTGYCILNIEDTWTHKVINDEHESKPESLV